MATYGGMHTQRAWDMLCLSAAKCRSFMQAMKNGAAPNVSVVAAELMLAGLITITIGRLVWSIVEPLPMPAEPPIIDLELTTPPAPTLTVNPFAARIASSAPMNESSPNEVITQTSLDLTLYGTWTGPAGGIAFIGQKELEQKRYRIGDKIADGVTLKEVHNNWVAIFRDGLVESIWIKNKQSPANSKSRASIENSIIASETDGRLKLPPGNTDPNSSTKTLNPGQYPQKLAAMGLAPGDAPIALDGEQVLGKKIPIPTIYTNLKKRKSIRLGVKPSGAPISPEPSVGTEWPGMDMDMDKDDS